VFATGRLAFPCSCTNGSPLQRKLSPGRGRHAEGARYAAFVFHHRPSTTLTYSCVNPYSWYTDPSISLSVRAICACCAWAFASRMLACTAASWTLRPERRVVRGHAGAFLLLQLLVEDGGLEEGHGGIGGSKYGLSHFIYAPKVASLPQQLLVRAHSAQRSSATPPWACSRILPLSVPPQLQSALVAPPRTLAPT